MLNRAFKEWAVVCAAMKAGAQIVLIRKGGIREEKGVFRVQDSEFFLMPTYEHQNAQLLQPAWAERFAPILAADGDPRNTVLDACAVVDRVMKVENQAQAEALASEYIWNARYVQQRFAFHPDDPLYLILLRVYHLPESISLPMRPQYVGCKSWVTLERAISTEGAVPALSDADYARRRAAILNGFTR